MATITRHHIPAGAYHIAVRGPILLQAFLGTCVAVSLYCKHTGIGGIIHLLLPQPVPSLPVTQPEKYAPTGLPLLLQKMLQMGAQRDALVACIANGALVGKFSQQELNLDIGGRTRVQIGIECERINTTIIDHHLRDMELSTASFAELIDLMPRSVFETVN